MDQEMRTLFRLGLEIATEGEQKIDIARHGRDLALALLDDVVKAQVETRMRRKRRKRRGLRLARIQDRQDMAHAVLGKACELVHAAHADAEGHECRFECHPSSCAPRLAERRAARQPIAACHVAQARSCLIAARGA
jgi:hypothetical protein